jgi:oxalate decarboxylase/phosphoglucose isomerase-like protein (cupin superfamily)
MITIRNWRSVHPTIAHNSGLDWRLLSSSTKTEGDIEVETEPQFRCLKNITYVSLAQLQPSLTYERHSHSDHEEIYYIIKGKGSIVIENENARFRDGDIIYIPPKSTHSITNDGEEMVEFLAFGSIVKDS